MGRKHFAFAALAVLALVLVASAAGGKLALSSSPHRISFGAFPSSSGFTAPVTVTFTNNRTAAIDTGDFDCSGDCGQFGVENNTCLGSTVSGSGGTCSMDIKFGPGAVGRWAATMYVNDRSTPPNHIGKVTVSGRGT